MDKQRDKELLESEIERICGKDSLIYVGFDDESNEGLEIIQKAKQPSVVEAREIHDDDSEPMKAYLIDTVWFSTDLNISRTLANWRQLPDNAGIDKLWEKTVDSDWSDVFQRNMSCA